MIAPECFFAAIGAKQLDHIFRDRAQKKFVIGGGPPGGLRKRNGRFAGWQVEPIADGIGRHRHQTDERIDDRQTQLTKSLAAGGWIALGFAQKLVGGLDVLANKAHRHAHVVGSMPDDAAGGLEDPRNSRAPVDRRHTIGEVIDESFSDQFDVKFRHLRMQRVPGPAPSVPFELGKFFADAKAE